MRAAQSDRGLPGGAERWRDRDGDALSREEARPTPRLPAPLRPLPWDRSDAPNTASVADRLRREGVEPSAWSNGPGDNYAVHQHGYTKLLMCAAGSITFLVGSDAVPVELAPGEGFVLPPGTPHAAVVGPAGCTCLEGHRPDG